MFIKLKEYEELLEFSERLSNDTLGLKNNEIRTKEPALDYVESFRRTLRYENPDDQL